MRKFAKTTELQAELKDVLAYAQTSKPSRRRLSRTLKDLGARTAGENKPIFDLVTDLQYSFINSIGRELNALCSSLHRSLQNTLEAPGAPVGHLRLPEWGGSWDYGTAKLHRGGGSIRVWNKDSPILTTKRGEEITGNLLVKLEFDFTSSSVHVELENENRTTIFKSTYSGANATPYEIAWDCSDAWKKVLLS